MRYCEIHKEKEESELIYGMDFRLPKYRREVFLRFYEFHLKYKSHPGAVYYVFPYLFEKFDMSIEQKLWFAFINGCSQNVITTYLLWKEFPDLNTLDLDKFSAYFRANYDKFGWDTDRRYEKNKLEQIILSYKENLSGMQQQDFFSEHLGSDLYDNFQSLWDRVTKTFKSFGRLATFSYLEYLRIVGLPIDCNSLFLDDINGSKSHRNGLCKVLGRDDLDWHHNDVKYNTQILNWLNKEAELLLAEAKQRIVHPDISYFTLESTLCCYKSWHRKNRRYPNVYNDMFFERIMYATKKWKNPKLFDIFWECRRESLPKHLLLEYNPKDLGVDPVKQNHYRNTGQVIMMDKEWECFTNDYNEYTSRK